MRYKNIVRIVNDEAKKAALIAAGYEVVGIADPTDAQHAAAEAAEDAAEDFVDTLDDQEAAAPVFAKIKALARTIALTHTAAVGSARTDYDGLTADQKALILNYSKLTAAEIRIVVLTLTALPDAEDVVSGDSAAITAARAKFNALTTEQKALVTNYERLTDAESAFVVVVIAALPDAANVVSGDAAAITAARTKYDALTSAQKSDVTNYTRLTDAEAALAAL